MIVLESPQGTGKSSLLQVLASPWALEGLPHTAERDVVDAMRGYWIVEMEELAHLQRAEVNQLKAFLSRTSDRARLAYARSSMDYPRRCIFVGTTNDSTYLKDSTGNRRFLPVKVTNIKLPELAAARDSLWAEARAAWFADPTAGAIALPVELREAAAEEQEMRRNEDPWEDTAEILLREVGDGRITTHDLLAKLGHKDPSSATTADNHRVARVMARFPKWEHKKIRSGKSTLNGYVLRSCTCEHGTSSHRYGKCTVEGCGCGQ